MLSCLFLAGCGSAGKADNEKTVAESKIANESNINEKGTEETTESESVKKDGDIDYDLTVMGADMVYATVYQMMIDPNSYVGKSFKIRGSYYSLQQGEGCILSFLYNKRCGCMLHTGVGTALDRRENEQT